MEKFDPQKYICKFGYEIYGSVYISNDDPYAIICDLYNRELKIEFYSKRTEEITESFGFKLSDNKFYELYLENHSFN